MLLKRTLSFLPAQLAGPALQFIMAVALTHWLAPAAYGTTMLIVAAQEFVYLVGLSWFSHYTMRYLAGFEGEAARERYQRLENTVLLGSALAQSGAALLVLLLIDEPWSTGLVLATIAFTVTRSLCLHLAERARSAGAVLAYSIGQLCGPGLGLLIGLAAVQLLPASADIVLGSFALAQAIGAAAVWRRLRLPLLLGGLDRTLLAAAFRFGGPLLVSGGCVWIAANVIRIIVNEVEGAVALGLMSVGWALGQRLASVAAMLVTAAAYPLAVKAMTAGDPRRAMAQISANGALLFAVLAPSAVGLMLVAEPLTRALVAAEFQAVTIALLPLAALCGMIRNLRIHFADQAYLLNEAPVTLLWLTAAEAALTVVLVTAGVLLDGSHGGIVGACVAASCGLVATYGLARRRYGLLVPLAHVVRVLLATAAMAMALDAGTWPEGAAGLVLQVGAGAAVYALALMLLNAGTALRTVRRLRAA